MVQARAVAEASTQRTTQHEREEALAQFLRNQIRCNLDVTRTPPYEVTRISSECEEVLGHQTTSPAIKATLAEIAETLAKNETSRALSLEGLRWNNALGEELLTDTLAIPSSSTIQLYLALRERDDTLPWMRRAVARAQEDERRRLSRELHDDIGSSLTNLSIQMENMARGSADVAEEIGTLVESVSRLIENVSRISRGLHPLLLDRLGLSRAIKHVAREFSRIHEIPCDIHTATEIDALDQDIQTTLYRVVQEALNNVAKHAHAKHVSVLASADENRIRLVVEDNGRGLPQATRWGLGLQSLRERVNLLEGVLTFEETPGGGATLAVSIPRKLSEDEQ